MSTTSACWASIAGTAILGSTSCHGRIDEMPLTCQAPSLLMEWCLDCHRNPQEHLRPPSEIFNVKCRAPADEDERGRALAEMHHLRDSRFLTSCWVCHR
jgi:hypothetical protein